MEKSAEEKKNDAYHGFDLYPARRSETDRNSFLDKIYYNRVHQQSQLLCEERVFKACKSNLLIKILIGALKNAGCPINLRRHIVCEECSNAVTGGYDLEFNQIVVCHNTSLTKRSPEATIVHELIHMYDNCVGKIDFKKFEHLACTEIRAANIAHCSFLSSFFLGKSSFINIKKTHQDCVKEKAAQSMMLSRNISYDTAMHYITKVFDKCYNDLEPIGRRIRRHSLDPHMAFKEAQHFGICDKEEIKIN